VVEEPGPDRWAPLLPPAEPAATAISPMKAVPEPREADPGVEREAERLLAELAQDEARRDRQTRLAGLQQRFDAATGLTGTARQLVLTLTGGLVLLTGLILGLTLLGLLL
jgi:hypothetical protein